MKSIWQTFASEMQNDAGIWEIISWVSYKIKHTLGIKPSICPPYYLYK
jgi:hypothetical protein